MKKKVFSYYIVFNNQMNHLVNDPDDSLFSGEYTYKECHTQEMLGIRAESLIGMLEKNFDNPNLGLLKKAFIDALVAKDNNDNHIWSEIHIRTFCGDWCFNALDEKKEEWSKWFASYPELKLKLK